MTLKELEIGKSAVIRTVGGEGALRQHILDMGLIPGVEVTMVKFAPMGDPLELRVHSYELTLRVADAEKIKITESRSLLRWTWRRRWIVPDSVRVESTTARRMSTRCRRGQC